MRWRGRLFAGHGRWARCCLVASAGGVMLAGCTSGVPSATGPAKKVPTVVTSPAARTGPDCPLTGTPAPGGTVPARDSLAIKVDNYPTARPQSGLTAADVIFEEPVEGRITRFVAVFQCHGTSMVGPVRSARNIDVGILGQLGAPLLVHVGGIQPVIADIQASPIVDVELGDLTSLIQHVPGRYAPYDTYTATTAVWKLYSSHNQAPQPLFSYSAVVPTGPAVNAISIPFSSYSPVAWRYNASTNTYLRYYGSSPDTLSSGVQNSTANVVVQYVQITYGPWTENAQGALEVQANLYTDASGPAMVFRNGVEVSGQWSRSSLSTPTHFTTSSGAPIALDPGTTWVELVPVTTTVSTTPPTG